MSKYDIFITVLVLLALISLGYAIWMHVLAYKQCKKSKQTLNEFQQYVDKMSVQERNMVKSFKRGVPTELGGYVAPIWCRSLRDSKTGKVVDKFAEEPKKE